MYIRSHGLIRRVCIAWQYAAVCETDAVGAAEVADVSASATHKEAGTRVPAREERPSATGAPPPDGQARSAEGQ